MVLHGLTWFNPLVGLPNMPCHAWQTPNLCRDPTTVLLDPGIAALLLRCHVSEAQNSRQFHHFHVHPIANNNRMTENVRNGPNIDEYSS